MPFTIKQGDRLPAIQIQLTEAGTPVDISSADSAVFFFRKENTSVTYSGTMTISVAASGIVNYAWGANQTNIPGDYEAEVVVYYAGLESTYPTDPDEPFFSFTILEGL